MGKGPLFVPEKLAFKDIFGDRGAVHSNKGFGSSGAQVVKCLGRQILAGARLSRDQDRNIGLADHLNVVIDLLHAGGYTNEALKGFLFFDPLPQIQVFPHQEAAFQGLFQEPNEVLLFKRLCNEIVGPFLDGFHRDFDNSEGGHHDDGEPGIEHLDPLKELDAVHPRHTDVHKGEIERGLFDEFQGLFAALGECDFPVHFGPDRSLQESEHINFIIDDQKSCLCHGESSQV